MNCQQVAKAIATIRKLEKSDCKALPHTTFDCNSTCKCAKEEVLDMSQTCKSKSNQAHELTKASKTICWLTNTTAKSLQSARAIVM